MTEPDNPGRTARRPTVSDVARRAGVSPKTVSRVINDVPSVDPTMAGRVREAARALGFRPNPVAADLRLGRSHTTIAMLTKDLGNPVYGTIAAGAADVARAHHAHLIIAHTGEDATEEQAVIEDLRRRRVDGMLVVPSGSFPDSRSEIPIGTPAVFLDRAPTVARSGGREVDTVTVDNRAGARLGIGALIDGGHRRIGVVLDEPGMPTMRDRLLGVQDALTAAAIPPEPGLVITGVADEGAAYSAAATLLDGPAPPSAFFCGNNRLSLGVLEYLMDRGTEEAVVGFDDIPGGRLLARAITCVSWDARQLGTAGAELLFRRLADDASPPSHVVLPTGLIRYGPR